MAIVSVNEAWRGKSWSDRLDGSREYERVFNVLTDDPNESAANVRAASGLPLPGEVYPDDAAAYVVDRSARQPDETTLLWEVTVTYAFQVVEPDDPLDMSPVIRWESGLYTRAIHRDKDGDAITNSAGDFFDPPSMAEFPIAQVTVTKNLTAVPSAILTIIGAVNTDAFTIDGVSVGIGNARVSAVSISELRIEQGTSFRQVTLGIELRNGGWKLARLDEGLRINDSGVLKDIVVEDEDGNEERASAPVPLDGSGAVLSNPTPATAVFREFDIHDDLEFGTALGPTFGIL